MGQRDLQPENFGASDPQAAEALLRSMTQDIENLRQNLVVQLSQDVERLQREKAQLIDDIERLKTQRQQQIVQQQQLVKQITPALANQLQELLRERINELPVPPSVSDRSTVSLDGSTGVGDRQGSMPLSRDAAASDYNENAYRLIASLDSTLRTTFKTLQQDLSSYQSSLSQQLGHMYSLEQQGEAILEALVSRLREEIQSESLMAKNPPVAAPTAPPPSPSPRRERLEYPENNHNNSTVASSTRPEPNVPLVAPEPPAAIPKPSPRTQPSSKVQLGFLLVLLSSLALSFLNVVITVILNKSRIFGVFELGGFISPSVGNSLLILWLRMLVVVPLMTGLTTILYPNMWRDIKQFAQSNDQPLFLKVIGSGFFLFVSQVLIYMALGPISPGVAITIFFIYPIVTVLLAWLLFGDRPSSFRSAIIACVLLGVVLIMLPTGAAKLSGLGVAAAAGSGIAFAIYVILTQMCAKKLHPIPFSWINFVIILGFSGLSLAGPLPESWRFEVDPAMWPSLIISSVILGAITLVSYLFNNIGISLIGAARASILGATGPALTALLALVVIQRALLPLQLFGMLLVTLGVAALSFERLRQAPKTPQTARQAQAK
ncbi:MAG: DMT family transporter [Microcoleus sp. SIO2G3]|nr:DMT family transporter [Microcoleus sp. SIO2G3]